MTIRANILAIQTRIQNDPTFAADFRTLAINALYEGLRQSDDSAWVKYMRHFIDEPATAETPIQLARLTTTAADNTTPYLREARAYLLGNGICIPGTITTLPQGIDNLLDQ